MTDPIGTHAAADLAGLTYRQVDYWIRRGYVQSLTASGEPFQHVPWSPTTPRNESGGSGASRFLDAIELAVLLLMARMVKAGLSVTRAARLARLSVTEDRHILALGGGLVLLVGPR